jgi:hypothetical protein
MNAADWLDFLAPSLIQCVQYYQYMVTFKDPRWLRQVVALVFTLDVAQTGQ